MSTSDVTASSGSTSTQSGVGPRQSQGKRNGCILLIFILAMAALAAGGLLYGAKQPLPLTASLMGAGAFVITLILIAKIISTSSRKKVIEQQADEIWGFLALLNAGSGSTSWNYDAVVKFRPKTLHALHQMWTEQEMQEIWQQAALRFPHNIARAQLFINTSHLIRRETAREMEQIYPRMVINYGAFLKELELIKTNGGTTINGEQYDPCVALQLLLDDQALSFYDWCKARYKNGHLANHTPPDLLRLAGSPQLLDPQGGVLFRYDEGKLFQERLREIIALLKAGHRFPPPANLASV